MIRTKRPRDRVVPGLRAWLVLGTGGLWIGVAAPVLADDGRDFAGQYEIVSRSPVDPETQLVTVRMRLQNVSGRAVSGAAVQVIEHPLQTSGTAFPSVVSFDDRQVTLIEGSFVVPTASASRWGQDGLPRFLIVFTDADGHEQRQPIEAAQAPLGGEG